MHPASKQQYQKGLSRNQKKSKQETDKTLLSNQTLESSQQQKSNKGIKEKFLDIDTDKEKTNQDSKFTMLDALKLLAMPLAIIVLLLLLFDAYQFSQYLHVSNKMRNNEQVDQKQLLYRLQWLTSLTLPVLREYFYEQKIFQIGKTKQWKRLIIQADKALAFSGNNKKFSIHYHKAMALCFMQKFPQCKLAADGALKQASRQNFKNLNDIYNILVSNNIMKASQIPTSHQMLSLSSIENNNNHKTLHQQSLPLGDDGTQFINLESL